MLKIAYDLFQELGLPFTMHGAVYLMDAIRYSIKDPTCMDSLHERLYPKVAELYGVGPDAIEKAIRVAVEAMFARGNVDAIYGLFGDDISPEKAKLTNKPFIKACVREVMRRMEMEE